MSKYELSPNVLNSRRGDYRVAILPNNPLIWKPAPLDLTIKRHQMVVSEIDLSIIYGLHRHPYWENEPLRWIRRYQDLYQRLFNLTWLNENSDRHNLVASEETCLTLVQYHDHRLIAYSRSTDMKNGYHSDKLVLDYLAEHINNNRPDCHVDYIYWYLAVPHVYEKSGIARLTEDSK